MINIKPQAILLALLLGGVLMSLSSSTLDWQTNVEVLRDSVILTWMVSLINMLLLGNGLGQLFGIRPRKPSGLIGIIFSPLLHRDIAHLIANTLPFLALGWLILLQGEFQGSGDFYAITATILLIGGLGTWLFGRAAIHMGASGIIFGYIGFLLIRGYVGPTLLTVGFALVVFLMYGNQLWGMLPKSSESGISWEGHLFGFLGGLIAGSRPDILATVGEAINTFVQRL